MAAFPSCQFFSQCIRFCSEERNLGYALEYGEVPGWSAWFDAKKPAKKKRDFLKQMNDIRVRATKTTPLKTKTTAQVTIPPEAITPELLNFLQGGAKGELRLEPTDPLNTEVFVVFRGQVLGKATLDQAVHALPEFEGRDVRDVGREYFQELEALCAKCNAIFQLSAEF